MKKLEKQKPTFESVWAQLQEFGRRVEESRADFDQSMRETKKLMEESRTDFDRRMKKFEETMGSWAKNHGTFAEEYFFNSYENGELNFFGEKFDEIAPNVTHYRQGVKDEFDIVLYNHSSVAIIEVKFKAHENDIPAVINKPTTFRFLFPEYKDFKFYLGLASLNFYPVVEKECIEQGIAVIKQVGDVVIINDGHLKVY